MTVHELTHTIRNDMPVYPGTEQPRLTTACTIDQCGYRETLLHMFSHTGTHMDAPAHMLRDGTALDRYDAAKFAGPAVVVDCRGQRAITLSLLQSYDLNGADFVLFCTGWDKKWGTPDYYEGFPCLTAEAAAYLAGLPLKGVGEDTISLDPCDSVDFPNHMTLLGADFVNTENLKGLDKLLGGGYINSGLHVIGARPAIGKSALALQIALNAAKAGTRVLYISLEMDPADCTARLVGNLGGGSAARYMFGGQLSEEEYRRFASGMSQLSRLPIVFNRRSGINIRQIEALCFREKPGLLVIDHLGLLEPPEKRLSLYEATTRNSRALKLLAMRLDIPILCLCQLNRAAASDRSGEFRATMANLRESGAIEQDADTVCLLHDPPCESNGAGTPSLLELWLDKNRRGPCGHVDATFYKATGRIVC